MKDLILMLKYARYEAIGFQIGEALGERLTRPEADALVPVPLHLRSPRRYNQAGAIAKGLGSVWDIEAWDVASWVEDVPSHAGMGAAKRLSLSSEAFAFNEDISGLRVAFVDDVCTTGATLSRLARAAQNHGAEVVGAFAAAHVPPAY
jgi:predicted amidophosphoribosyltransferase